MPTKKLYLSVKYRKKIENLFRRYLPDVDVWAYGSRVNGKSHPASDLDLVLRAPHLNNIDGIKLIDLKSALTDSNIPFLVEVRDWSLLPKSFHEEIKKNYIVLLKSDNKKATIPAQLTIPAEPVIPDVAGIQKTPSPKNTQPLNLKQGNTKEASNQPAQPVIPDATGIQNNPSFENIKPFPPVIPAKAGIQKTTPSKIPQLLGLKQKGITTAKASNQPLQSVIPAKAGIQKIPAHWDIFSISDIGEVITGTTPKTANKAYYGNEYKLISPADLDSGQYVTTAHRILSKEGLSQCRILPQYTVLVGCIGNVGKIGMTIDQKCATNQQINAIICNKKADPYFIFYLLGYSRDRLKSASAKTTVPILNKNNFEKFQIPLPPMQEQKKIAGVLSQIQRAMEVQDKLIERTEELKQATMKQLFTYGLNHKEKPNNSSTQPVLPIELALPAEMALPTKPVIPASSAMSAQSTNPISSAFPAKPLKAKSLAFNPTKTVIPAHAGIQTPSSSKPLQPFSLKPEVIKEEKASDQLAKPVIPVHAGIQKIPAHWDIFSISDIGEVITGTTPKTANKAYYGNEYKLISPADLDSGQYVTTAHRILSKEGLSQCRILPQYTVLVGCIGNVGKIGMTIDQKCATNQQINAIICNKKADPYFIFYLLGYSRDRLKSASAKTTVPILNKK